jgi:His/Glu/Gln/Arg/opine family amino acid ABC transporter permease subunit
MAETVRRSAAGPEAVAPRTGPPDVGGTSSPWALSIFAAGIAALVLVIGGVALVQVAYALQGGRITSGCRAVGLVPFAPQTPTSPATGIRGAEGVCNIVEATRATPTTLLLWLGVVVGVAAIAAGFGTYKRMETRRRREHSITGAVLGIQAVVIGASLLWFRLGRVDRFASQFLNFERLQGYWVGFIGAAKNTLFLAFGGEIGGIVAGLVLAMLAISSRRAVRAPARAYINFFRGTPLLWQLSFFYFGIVLGLNLPLGVFAAAIIVFILNTGAYAAEVFRAGIQSIERGQMEAARSLGMTYLQAMRFAIVPQAVRRVIPPLMNEFVILIKDTALVLVLGLARNQLEIFNYAQEGYSSTFNATFFVVAAIAYLTVTLPLIRLVNIAERRLRGGLLGLNIGQQGL